jgi:serine/threonine protein kinase
MNALAGFIITDSVKTLPHSTGQEHTLIGKFLGNRYRVLREVGSGGMAWVYLAEDNKENKLVAVKVLYPQFCEDIAYIQRFNREAKLASTLTDPHIVRVLDYGADRDIHYLIMEYIEGRDLREVLEEQGPFLWKQALEIIDQLATALEHAHLYGVVHRDIKPQNMMLTDGGLLKVLDFGIARIPTLPSLTQSGFIGSPYYVSPEQATGDDIDTRSDIYSAGIVLYELLSGKIPFDAKSPWSIINQHLGAEPPPIRLPNNDELPEVVNELLNRMVAKRPENRFPNPNALRRAIGAVLAGNPIPDSTLDTQPLTPPDRQAMAESLYQRALKAMEDEEWSRAADLLNQVLNMAPNHNGAAKNMVLAEQKSFVVSLYNAGKRALDSDRWEEAINSFSGVMELEPDYKDAQTLLAQSLATLEKVNAEQLLTAVYNEGLAHLEAKRWELALNAFEEVKRLSPTHKKVDMLLAETKRHIWPPALQKLQPYFTDKRWQIGLSLAAILLLGIVLVVMSGSGATDQNAQKEHLKALYEQVQQAIAANDNGQAVALLDQILKEDPDYADAASLKRDLTTPALPTAAADPLAQLLETVQSAVNLAQWDEALNTLQEIRAQNPTYEKARTASLFCDASVGRGMESIANLQANDNMAQIVAAALADFEAGAAECPRRTDLRDQAERAAAFAQALNTPATNHDTLVQLLTPIVAADPTYAAKKARRMLYSAYVERGDARREAGETVGALGDYEAALAVHVDDPSLAQMHRAELLLGLGQQVTTVELAVTPAAPPATPETAATESTPEPVRIKYRAPALLTPDNDTIFPGKFAQVFLEWEPAAAMASDEYYDLTVMYIFADEPAYWGTATRDTRIQLTPDIGVGKAGQDRFYWWVTVRKANTAPYFGALDLPVSAQSEGRSFVWVP